MAGRMVVPAGKTMEIAGKMYKGGQLLPNTAEAVSKFTQLGKVVKTGKDVADAGRGVGFFASVGKMGGTLKAGLFAGKKNTITWFFTKSWICRI